MEKEDLAKLVENDAEFQGLESEISDDLMLQYTKDFITQEEFNRDSLDSYGLIFHEKWEIRELLRIKGVIGRRYSKRNLWFGKVRPDDYLKAHESAEQHELLFYQRIGQAVLGIKIPTYTLKYAREFCKEPESFIRAIYQNCEKSEEAKKEGIKREDVQNVIRLFQENDFEG